VRFTPDLEDKVREMKKLENEWAAKRRTANDVSADVQFSPFDSD
jgi:hypothetical protein